MSLEQVKAKAEVVPRERLQPNLKGRLRDQFHEVALFRHLGGAVTSRCGPGDWKVARTRRQEYHQFFRRRTGGLKLKTANLKLRGT